MKDKLYSHHAIQDSIEVSDSEIYDYVDQSIDYFSEQLGSLEKALEFYNKSDEATFREELFELNKQQKLSSMMQSKIVEKKYSNKTSAIKIHKNISGLILKF